MIRECNHELRNSEARDLTVTIPMPALYPYQKELIKDLSNLDIIRILLSGGRGNGKSYFAALYTFYTAVTYAPMELVTCAPVYRQAANAVERPIKTLFEMLDEVIPHKFTKHRKNEYFELWNGSIIHIYNLQEPGRLKSLNASYIWIDEFTEIPANRQELVWAELNSILRSPETSPLHGRERMLITTNPSGKHTLLYKKFFVDDDKEFYVKNTTAYDNPKASPAFLRNLEKLPNEAIRRRYLLGEWTELEGAMYHITDAHRTKEPLNGTPRYYLSFDFGYMDDFVCLLIGYSDGCVQIVDEVNLVQANFKHHFAAVSQLIDYNKIDITGLMGDSQWRYPNMIGTAQSGLIVFKKVLKTRLIPTSKRRLTGWLRILEYLNTDVNGVPQLTINPKCKRTLESLESMQWAETKEDAVEGDDHNADALRYFLMSGVIK